MILPVTIMPCHVVSGLSWYNCMHNDQLMNHYLILSSGEGGVHLAKKCMFMLLQYHETLTLSGGSNPQIYTLSRNITSICMYVCLFSLVYLKVLGTVISNDTDTSKFKCTMLDGDQKNMYTLSGFRNTIIITLQWKYCGKMHSILFRYGTLNGDTIVINTFIGDRYNFQNIYP